MSTSGFLRWSGAALATGGALTLLINVALTPRLAAHAPFTETAASPLFVWRQGASTAAAACLLFGAVGLHLRQASRAGWFGALAFVLAFLGGAMLLATEWAEVFVVHTLALGAPQSLAALESGHGPTLYDLGSMIAFATFALGWIALAAATLRAGAFPRAAAWLVIVGLFATPLLGAALHGAWGAAVGNAILGAGWFWLGLDVARARPSIT
jgi:hypothetical protein